MLASDFCSFIEQENLGKNDFDEETRAILKRSSVWSKPWSINDL